jgi:hypothetical protein
MLNKMRPFPRARRTKRTLVQSILVAVAMIVWFWVVPFVFRRFIFDKLSPLLQSIFSTSLSVVVIGVAAAIVIAAICVAVQQQRVRRWRAAGACLSCGYSLEGNASGVCPECGTPVLHPLVVSTADFAVMRRLGALRRWATREVRDPQKRPADRKLHWEPGRFEAVFYFETPELEANFLAKANELLPEASWKWTKPPGGAG